MIIKDVDVEALTVEAFTPYGWLLAAGGTSDFERPGLKNWRIPFNSDQCLRLQVMRYSTQQRHFSMFERHLQVTEARSPIGDAAAIVVVAGDPALEYKKFKPRISTKPPHKKDLQPGYFTSDTATKYLPTYCLTHRP